MRARRLGRSRQGLTILALALGGLTAVSRPVWGAVLWGGPPRPTVDQWGRLVDPRGRLTELGYFVTGSALTPDGRFLWTIGAGRVANDVEIVRTADGKVVQSIDDPAQALEGGVAISPDGRHAYVADTHDSVGVRMFAIDPRTGHARAAGTVPLPVPSGTPAPDDFPPRTPGSGGQSYAAGIAVSADGRKLVVAENLDDYAAIVDVDSRRVTQVALKANSAPGDHAFPHGVAIVGRRAYLADEGDGTVTSFSIDDPGAGVQTVTPTPAQPDPAAIDLSKTHPFQIIATPGGKHLLLTETNADRVLELDPTNLAAAPRVVYVRRSEGIGTNPVGLAVTPDGSTLFVADGGENAVRAIALVARTIPQRQGSALKIPAGGEIARIPTGIYPDRVELDARTGQLEIISAYGVGPGNTGNSDQSGPGVGDLQQSSIRILSTLQSFDLSALPAARDQQLVALGRGGAAAAVPVANVQRPPADTPLSGPDGGPSRQIKYVFYVVAENKTYDIQLGDLTRDPKHPLQPGRQRIGNGTPCLVVFGETRSLPRNRDGSPCPQSRFLSKDPNVRVNPGQVMDGQPLTPNQHKLARQFVTLDNTYADTTTSDDGHLFTSSGYQSDYELRGTEANNGPSPRPFDLIYPQASPPKGFIFDQFARDGISFFNYGEAVSGTLIPDVQLSPQERAIRADVLANSDYANYPSSAAIDTNPISAGVSPNVDNPASLAATGRERVDDSNQPNELQNDVAQNARGVTVPVRQSRMLYFENRFRPVANSAGCLASPSNPSVCKVPQFTELIMPNNHTAGTNPGGRTPDALVRDNDLAIGQIADLISHSPIWPYAAIFVIQDDSQDGSDHVNTRRISAFVISPYARHQAVDSTHYDQAGVIHTMDMILGSQPEYLQDALATPMYNAFTSKPDLTPFNSVPFTQAQLDEINSPRAPMADVSAHQRWSADAVSPNLVNQITYAYRYGTTRACPSDLGADHNNPCAISTPAKPKPMYFYLGPSSRYRHPPCPITWACRPNPAGD